MFALTLIPSSLNWIASPALAKTPDEFNNAPVDAGPFTLTKWARQDVIELERNPRYWDDPKPYLDRVTLKTVPDANQRLNLVTTGSVDLMSESSWSTLARVEAAGFPTETVPVGGGQYLVEHQACAF